MNIKVPKNMQSPTVLIIGQGTMTEKSSPIMEKRMDMLERQLDRQYKLLLSNTKPQRQVDVIHRSFASPKKTNGRVYSSGSIDAKRFNSLKSQLTSRINSLKSSNGNGEYLKRLSSKLDRLERAIVTMKKSPSNGKTVRATVNTGQLNRAFDSFYDRIEKEIQKLRPRTFATHG